MTRLLSWKSFRFLLFCIAVLPATIAFGQDYHSEFDLLPRGIEIHKDFRPGVGTAIGNINQVKGRVVVIHMNQTVGYTAVKGIPLFKNDTVVTLEDAQADLLFNDGSNVLLTARTRLQINQSVYSPRENRRAAMMNMAVGMARFMVRRIADVRQSDYNVKTHTTVVGARGSDFIVEVRPEATEISALEDTLLEVRSLAMPDEPPLLLKSFEQTMVRRGERATEARHLEAEEVDRLMREFVLQPRMEPETIEDPAPPLVDEDELHDPPGMEAQRFMFQAPPGEDPTIRAQDHAGNIQETRRSITEQQLDQTVRDNVELSDFPGTPDS